MKPVPALLSSPWAVEPSWLRAAFAVWSRGALESTTLAKARTEWQERERHKVQSEEPGAPVEGTGGTLRIVGSVGVLSIEGALFRHANLMQEFSGGTTYDSLWRGLEVCRTSPAIKSIVLKINSPGGESDGCSALAKYVRTVASEKPMTAFADGMCASAAYWLASQAGRIVAEETSAIGSIGVRSGITDTAKAEEAAGVREIEIVSSVSPGKRGTPVDDEVIGRIQTRVDDLASVFVAAVADGRGVSVDKVASDFGQGDVMIASKALAAGLIDEIGSFGGALAAASTSTGAKMSVEAKPASSVEAGKGGAEWPCTGCKEMMGPSAAAYCSKCAVDDEGEPDGDEDEDARAATLAALGVATFAEARGKAVALVERSAQLDAVNAELAALKADGIKRDLRSTLAAGLDSRRLSLGAAQKVLPTLLRGDARTAWAAAMGKVDSVSRESVIEAACAVAITADDLASVRAYIDASGPTVAPVANEPPRDAIAEANEMDAKIAEIDRIAAEVRKRFPTAAATAPAK